MPFGLAGIFFALPFAVWFYLGIEELPLASEETHDPARDLPRGILWGLGTLIVFALLTLVLNSSIAPGAAKLSTSGEPLLDGFRTIFGDAGGRVLGLVATAGLIASFHGIMFAYGRQIYSLSRAGYFPQFLSLTHATRKTPWVALVAGGVLGLGALVVIRLSSPAGAGAIIGGKLLAMAVFGAMISYVLQMASFVILRVRFPAIARPYRSAAGIPGALIAGDHRARDARRSVRRRTPTTAPPPWAPLPGTPPASSSSACTAAAASSSRPRRSSRWRRGGQIRREARGEAPLAERFVQNAATRWMTQNIATEPMA